MDYEVLAATPKLIVIRPSRPADAVSTLDPARKSAALVPPRPVSAHTPLNGLARRAPRLPAQGGEVLAGRKGVGFQSSSARPGHVHTEPERAEPPPARSDEPAVPAHQRDGVAEAERAGQASHAVEFDVRPADVALPSEPAIGAESQRDPVHRWPSERRHELTAAIDDVGASSGYRETLEDGHVEGIGAAKDEDTGAPLAGHGVGHRGVDPAARARGRAVSGSEQMVTHAGPFPAG